MASLRGGEGQKRRREGAVVGNVALRLGVGEQSLGALSIFCLSIYITDWSLSPTYRLYKRMGKESRAQKWINVNRLLAQAVEELARRGTVGS